MYTEVPVSRFFGTPWQSGNVRPNLYLAVQFDNSSAAAATDDESRLLAGGVSISHALGLSMAIV